MKERVKEHNKDVIKSAEYRSQEMKLWPSPLEERMTKFLDSHGIEYQQQRIFYIYADDGWIIRYYIADFYIPGKKMILEVDGKFHDKQKQHDKERTRIIMDNYPDVGVVRWTMKDFGNKDSVNRLLSLLS